MGGVIAYYFTRVILSWSSLTGYTLDDRHTMISPFSCNFLELLLRVRMVYCQRCLQGMRDRRNQQSLTRFRCRAMVIAGIIGLALGPARTTARAGARWAHASSSDRLVLQLSLGHQRINAEFI